MFSMQVRSNLYSDLFTERQIKLVVQFASLILHVEFEACTGISLIEDGKGDELFLEGWLRLRCGWVEGNPERCLFLPWGVIDWKNQEDEFPEDLIAKLWGYFARPASTQVKQNGLGSEITWVFNCSVLEVQSQNHTGNYYFQGNL